MRAESRKLLLGMPLMVVAYSVGAPLGIAFAAYALVVITDLLKSPSR